MGGPTILLVEDELLIRLMMAEQLKSRGFTIIEAADADEALAMLNAGLSFDLLLADVKMPGTLDGVELARLVRAKQSSVKVILGSAHVPLPGWTEAADAICAKPYDLAELTSTINGLLGLQPRSTTPQLRQRNG
jgi:two-component system, response regulator PdtaR